MIFVGLRPGAYVYIADDYEEEKKTKGAKKYIIKQELKIDDYGMLRKQLTILRSKQGFKSNTHSV